MQSSLQNSQIQHINTNGNQYKILSIKKYYINYYETTYFKHN